MFVVVYVCDGNKKIPIEYESTGIVKLISMISSITSLISTTDSLVLIDELDAHVFEYLLSTMVIALNKHIHGILIFTSHNLTQFESLSKENLVVASKNTKNEIEFSRFKHQTNTTNIRDVFIRLQNYGEENALQKSNIDAAKIEYLFEDIELGLV